MRHGTYPGYTSHLRNAVPVCDLCRGARRENARLQRLKPRPSTRARIVEYMELDGPRSLRQIINSVEGLEDTIRQTVWRMRRDRQVVYNSATSHYTLSIEEG